MVVVVAQAPKVIERDHLEVPIVQHDWQLLSNSLQDSRTCLLLNTDRESKLAALLSLLRRDFIPEELPVCLALFVRANVHDGSGFAAVHHDCDLRVRTLPLSLTSAIRQLCLDRIVEIQLNLNFTFCNPIATSIARRRED